MAGEHINALRRAVAGMNLEDVATSRDEWAAKVGTLDDIAKVVRRNRTGVRDGFGAGSQTAESAVGALDGMNGNLIKRANQLRAGHTELVLVHEEMVKAIALVKKMPDSPPGPAPVFDDTLAGDSVEEKADALVKFAAKTGAHAAKVNAYGESDDDARRQLDDLNAAYDRAAAVFARIGGPPPEDDGDGNDGRTPTTHTPTQPSGRPPHVDPPVQPPTDQDSDDPDPDTDTDPDDDKGTDTDDDKGTDRTPDPEADHEPPTTDSEHPPPGTEPGPGPRIDLSGPAPVGLGLLGGLGVRNLLTSAPPVTVPGQAAPRPLGTTGRAPGSGVLGRGGGVPGQPVGRGGVGGRAAGGRTAGGRAAGGRGGAGLPGSAGARGRRDDERGQDGTTYDVEEDWTEDDGQYPGVLG